MKRRLLIVSAAVVTTAVGFSFLCMNNYMDIPKLVAQDLDLLNPPPARTFDITVDEAILSNKNREPIVHDELVHLVQSGIDAIALETKPRKPMTDDEKEQFRKQLMDEFDAREKERTEEIDQLQQRLDQMKKLAQTRQANRDRIVELRMNQLLDEPDPLRWESMGGPKRTMVNPNWNINDPNLPRATRSFNSTNAADVKPVPSGAAPASLRRTNQTTPGWNSDRSSDRNPDRNSMQYLHELNKQIEELSRQQRLIELGLLDKARSEASNSSTGWLEQSREILRRDLESKRDTLQKMNREMTGQ